MNHFKVNTSLGNEMYALAEQLFPICRSLTGNGVRETLRHFETKCPELKIFEIPSGTRVFDWTIPKEWNIKNAYIKDEKGNSILDFTASNLHVMGYSTPVNAVMTRNELLKNVYTEPSQPDAIPYVTSYYKERFGFCMTENQRSRLMSEYAPDAKFKVCIDSTLEDGFLTYGEIIIPPPHIKQSERSGEIFFSTYICHPSMANNELSGPCLAIFLANWIKQLPERRFTYRFVFIPENIGATAYISRNIEALRQNTLAGFNLTCVGDNRTYSYLESRYADTLADKVLENVLKFHYPEYKRYPFLKSGSDERRYNAPGVELPVVGFSRSLYGEYPEYHTSADDLSLISPEGLKGSFDVITQCIKALENNNIYKVTTVCEPQLGKRGLYPTVSRKGQYDEVLKTINFLSYADGKNDLIDISNIINVPVCKLLDLVKLLKDQDLIEVVASL